MRTSSDDELVIRHLRLCDCGKPAGHDSICRPAGENDPENIRVDADWEERRARKREAKHADREHDRAAGLRWERQHADTLAMHQEALHRALLISTVKAGSVEPTRGGDPAGGAPFQQTFADDPRWREHWDIIRSRLTRVLELLDEAEGHGTVAGTPLLIREEKQRRVIRDGRGLSPLAVVEKLGRDIAGSPKTVVRDRIEAVVCIRDGHEPHPDTCAGPNGHPCMVCRRALDGSVRGSV